MKLYLAEIETLEMCVIGVFSSPEKAVQCVIDFEDEEHGLVEEVELDRPILTKWASAGENLEIHSKVIKWVDGEKVTDRD